MGRSVALCLVHKCARSQSINKFIDIFCVTVAFRSLDLLSFDVAEAELDFILVWLQDFVMPHRHRHDGYRSMCSHSRAGRVRSAIHETPLLNRKSSFQLDATELIIFEKRSIKMLTALTASGWRDCGRASTIKRQNDANPREESTK